MRVLPAIDVLENQVVRLSKGVFSEKTPYLVSPVEAAAHWKSLGFSFVHIVSLDGARDGETRYLDVLREIRKIKLQIQFGGGVRSLESVRELLSMGMDRIMIGTAAIKHQGFWKEAVDLCCSDRFVLALDVRDGFVATHGWTQDSVLSVSEVVKMIGEEYISHILVTDIQKDGSLSGSDPALYKTLLGQFPHMNIIPAGGVSSVKDLEALQDIGVKEVVIGKALYEIPGFVDEIIDHQYI